METRRLAYHMMCDYLHLYVYIVLHVREIFPPFEVSAKRGALFIMAHRHTQCLTLYEFT